MSYDVTLIASDHSSRIEMSHGMSHGMSRGMGPNVLKRNASLAHVLLTVSMT